jgi:hypothetical protein
MVNNEKLRNMKKYILILLAVAALAWSCDDGRDGNIGQVQSLTAESRIQAVVLEWANPDVDNYYYSVVNYVNSDGDTVRMKVSKYSDYAGLGDGYTSVLISGFTDTNTYEFFVTPYSSEGWPGTTQSVSCAPEDVSSAYKYIASTAQATPLVEGAIVSWENDYGETIIVNISYNDVNGDLKTKTIESSSTDSVEIYAFVNPTTINITTSDEDGNVSDTTSISCTPLTGEIPHDRMFVATCSSMWDPFPTDNLLDDDVETIWVTNPYIVESEYGHWFIIDMRAPHVVNWIELVRGSGTNAENVMQTAPSQVKFEYSNDGENFTEIGTYDFDASLNYNHTFNFDPLIARWIRVYCVTSMPFTFMGEFLAYYADVADHYADEAASELEPDPDDDSTYYATTEYMIPLSSYVNNLTVTATNTDNPSQYLYETTGGDPYVAMSAMSGAVDGPVLVFQYKCNQAIRCEFFWCPNGYGVGGPTGGVETAFNLSAADDWTTMKINFATSFSNFGWGSNAGDQVRFDVGDGSGIELEIRNMHWRAAVDGDPDAI